jgi:putative transposase
MDIRSALIFIAAACLGTALIWGLSARFYYIFRKKEPPKYIGVTLFCLTGLFATIISSLDLYETKTSSVIHTKGVITQVVLAHAKRDHYWFTFTTDSGSYRLDTDYGGPGLQNGEVVEISFLEKPSTLIYLKVLDPPAHRGLEIHEGDGTGRDAFMLLFGTGSFGLALYRQHLSTYALTILTHQRHSHFQRAQNAELFISTLFRYRDVGKFQLHGFAIMLDRVHILITPTIDQSTSRCLQLIMGGYSFAIRDQSPGEIWHAGYHEHRIRDTDDFQAQRQYIANNPIRKHLADYPHVHTAPQYISRIDLIVS